MNLYSRNPFDLDTHLNAAKSGCIHILSTSFCPTLNTCIDSISSLVFVFFLLFATSHQAISPWTSFFSEIIILARRKDRKGEKIIGIAMIVCFVFCSAATNDGAEFASNRFMVQQQQKPCSMQIKFSNYKFMRSPNEFLPLK